MSAAVGQFDDGPRRRSPGLDADIYMLRSGSFGVAFEPVPKSRDAESGLGHRAEPTTAGPPGTVRRP